ILISLICITSFATAQKKLTLEQVILNSAELTPKKLEQLKWIPETENFSYIESLGDNQQLISESVNGDSKDVLVLLSDLNNILKNSQLQTSQNFPLFSWYSSSEIWFWDLNKLVLFNISTKELTVLNEIDAHGENPEFIDPKRIAYTVDNNLFISNDFRQLKITNDSEGIVNGQTVHRNEFGIKKGIFWAPNDNYFAFYRKDETMVTDYPIIDISSKPALVDYIKYPMAGMTSEKVTVGVYNILKKEITWLNTGDANDQYLPGITWSPDSKYIFINQLNRDQNHLKLSKYDAQTGEFVKVLFEEINEKYVEPEHGPIFFEGEPAIFIWQSRNEGWNHLSLYDAAGNRIKKLNSGDWEVTEFNGFDKIGINIFYTSTEYSPLERHFYKLSMDSYESKKITNEGGFHNVTILNKGKYFLDEFSSLTLPYRVDLLNGDGELIRTVYEASNPLSEYSIGKTEIFTIKSNSDFDLYSRIIYPPDFDEIKKYPVLVFLYGGPHRQKVENSWLGNATLWLNYMAQKEFLVFTIDNRGSAFRGLDFEQATFRKLGTVEIEDQLKGIEYLKSLPFVDIDKIGVFGWSYGGFMSASLMTRAPEIFKVGAAGGAVIDWQYYEVMYTERYMDTPETNPDGFEESNVLNYIQNLKGKLLLLHGTSDPVVVWQHTLLLAERAAHLGIELDYYPYIGHKHGVTGRDKLHLYQKITSYFLENLK
ncbi:MAG: prolyl oligopeptidase family serine peptidase, partial [Ignavibacteriaceae bacterium]|nr:prolyl oligopeptidase family serine peptidase [Ignavibacteriaceae bacterium]